MLALLAAITKVLEPSEVPVFACREPVPERLRVVEGAVRSGSGLLFSWSMDVPVPGPGEVVESGPYRTTAVATGHKLFWDLLLSDGSVRVTSADGMLLEPEGLIWIGSTVTIERVRLVGQI